MSKLRYKYCVVPGCKNTTVKAPHKLYFSIPGDATLRARWSRAMGRDEARYKPLRYNRFCCEDHFDLQNDMENYMQWKLIGVKVLKLRSGVLPHKFHCQVEMQKDECINTPELERVDKGTVTFCKKEELKKENNGETENHQKIELNSSLSTSGKKSHEVNKKAIKNLNSNQYNKYQTFEKMQGDSDTPEMYEYVVKLEYESDESGEFLIEVQ